MSLINPASRILIAGVIGLSKGTEIIGLLVANNLHKRSWTILPHGKKVQTQDWQVPQTSSCQCECNGCAKPPYTPKMKRHSLMLHKAHIMCSSQVTLQPNRRSKIVNLREKKKRERQTKRHRDLHTPLYTALWRMGKAGHHQSTKQGPCEWGLTCKIVIVG